MTPDELDQWLIAALSEHGGRADMSVIQAAATTAGIHWRRIERAKTRLGIVTDRSGFREVTTVWKLPADLAATVVATDGNDGDGGFDGNDATVTDSSEWGSLAPLAAALDLLGGVVDAARPMLAKFAAGRLPRQQVADLKWTVAAANRSLETMSRQGITLDSLRRMVRDEAKIEISAFFDRVRGPMMDRLASGLGYDPNADDVRDVMAWAVDPGGEPQPPVPERKPPPVRSYPPPHTEKCGRMTEGSRVTWLCEHEFEPDGRGWKRRADGDPMRGGNGDAA